MIKFLLIFLFLYLTYGIYLAFDWITCKTTHFTVCSFLVTVICAIGVIILGPGWIFLRVFHILKGE